MMRAVLPMVVLALAGCADGDTDTGVRPGACPDVPALIEAECGLCHGGDAPSADLDLISAGWEEDIVGAAGTQCLGVLADPARPSESLLYTKLLPSPDCGAPMPMGADPLTEDEARCVRDWIAGLVPPEDDTDEDCPECECEPDEVEACYTGPDDTLDVGACVEGTRTCDPEGSWGPCEGQVLPRTEDCRTPHVDEDCDGATPECSDRWVGVFGGDESQVFRSVAVDSQGEIAILGDFAGTVAFGDRMLTADGDKQDYVLLKLDVHGNVLWAQRFGDTSNQWATQVTVAPDDDIVLVGRAFGKIDLGGGELDAVGTDDVVIARFAPDGTHRWSQMVGGPDPDRAETVVVTPDGDVVLAGSFTGTARFGVSSLTAAGFRDAFVLRLDGETGRAEWVVPLGGVEDDHAVSVTVDDGGELTVAGRFGGEATFGEWAVTSAGGQDVFVTRLAPSGVVRWVRRFGGEAEERVDAIVADPASGVLTMAGYTDGTVDFGGGPLTTAGSRDLFVVGLDSEGAHRWSSLHGDAEDQFDARYDTSSWLNLVRHPDGGVALGGSLQGNVAFDGPTLGSRGKSDFMAVRLSDTGSYLGGRTWGSGGTELLHDLAVSDDGDIVLVGRFWSGPVDFGEAGTARDRGTSSEAVVAKVPVP